MQKKQQTSINLNKLQQTLTNFNKIQQTLTNFNKILLLLALVCILVRALKVYTFHDNKPLNPIFKSF